MFSELVERDGFAVIPEVLQLHEVSDSLLIISQAQQHRSRAGIRHLMSDANVATIANDSRMLRIASEILGISAIPFRATLFNKSPNANWLVVWHQDTALPIRLRKETTGWGPWSVKEGITYAHAPTKALNQVIALRIHLDDSTELNGPLRVLPGTHKLGVLTDDEVHKLSEVQSPVDCVALQGAVLVMRPLLIHSSSKAETDAPRRVLHIEYSSSMIMGNGLELAVA